MAKTTSDVTGLSSSAAPRVFTIPPGQPFLDCLARAILRGDLPRPGSGAPSALELPGILLLLPTRRACRAMQDAFLRVSDGVALLLPRIRPIAEGDEAEGLILGMGDPVLAGLMSADAPPAVTKLERHLVLTQLVMAWARARKHGGDPLSTIHTAAQAAGLAGGLAQLMDMVETEEADFDRLGALVPEMFADHWRQTVEFLQIVTQAWPAHLAERNLISVVARRRRLLDAEAVRLAAHDRPAQVIIAGVSGSVPATARLMRAAAGQPLGAVVLPGLDMALPDDAWQHVHPGSPAHPQFRLAGLLRGLGLERRQVRILPGAETTQRQADRNRFVGEAMRPAAATGAWRDLAQHLPAERIRSALAQVTYLEAGGAEEEAEAVALILRHVAETPGRTAALVSPDRILARRVAIRLQSWGITVDDSAGRPFAKTTPGTFLDLLVQAVESDFSAAALMALLKHPLTRLGRTVAEVRRGARMLELAALRRTTLGTGLAHLSRMLLVAIAGREDGEDSPLAAHPAIRRMSDRDKGLARDILERLTAAMQPMTDLIRPGTEASVTQLAAAHGRIAEAVARDETGSSRTLWVGEAGEAAAVLLAGLIDESLPQITITSSDYPELYRGLVASDSVRSRATVHPRLSIWGPFEARLQQPDIVILGGLNDRVWPETPEPDPWLNRPMLAALGLPAPETRIGDSAHDFTQLLGAERIYLTRAAKIDGVPTVPSRWLMRIQALLGGAGLADVLAPDPKEPWLHWARNRDAVELRQTASAPEPRPPVAARPRQMSVTRIEDWIANPYTIFARDILRLERMPELGAEPDAALRGRMIHAALHRFSTTYPGPLPSDIAGELERLALAVLADHAAHPRIAAFWRPRFRRFADWFAATEPGRRQGIGSIHPETKGALVLAAPAGPFRLTARADRIDRREDGGLVITDYKTGRAPDDKRVTSALAPQLPLEAAIGLAGGFEGLAAGPVAVLRYVSASGAEPPGEERQIKCDDIAALAKRMLSGLERLISAYDDPATGYRAVRRPAFKDGYRYDDYAHLARVKEWGEGGSDD